jgi:hypothetical protein
LPTAAMEPPYWAADVRGTYEMGSDGIEHARVASERSVRGSSGSAPREMTRELVAIAADQALKLIDGQPVSS